MSVRYARSSKFSRIKQKCFILLDFITNTTDFMVIQKEKECYGLTQHNFVRLTRFKYFKTIQYIVAYEEKTMHD